MKSFIEAAFIAALISAPLAAFAQSNQPLTRAQMRADVVQVKNPENIPAAEPPVAADKGAAQADASGYGSNSNGTSQVGNWGGQAVSTYSAPVAHYGQ